MPVAQGGLRIAIIGAGKMGQAILSGWLEASSGPANGLLAQNFSVVNPGLEKRQQLSQSFGVACVEEPEQLEPADVVLLAVKPQALPLVLEQLSPLEWISGALVVSIAAGVGTSAIESALPDGVRVVRVMPNIGLAVGQGASVVCAGASAEEDDVQLVVGLFSSVGLALQIDESQIDIATAISGSGPAYVAALVEALAQTGAQAGLEEGLAEQLAAATVLGTGKIMVEGKSAAQTRLDVCSPGGTTLAALQAMEQAGYSKSIKRGVDAAVARAKELGA